MAKATRYQSSVFACDSAGLAARRVVDLPILAVEYHIRTTLLEVAELLERIKGGQHLMLASSMSLCSQSA